MGMTLQEAEDILLAPGSPFEITTETVNGEIYEVFANRARSLRDLLARSVDHGDRELFIWDDGRRYTFAQHERLVASTATAMADRFGIGPGDRVALLGANSPEWIIGMWAAISLGAIAVGMNGWWTGDEIAYGLELTEPKLLIADHKRLARLKGAEPPMATVVVEDDFDHQLAGFDLAAPLPDAPIHEDDPAVVLFTSGTTGRPKGAINTHRNIIAFLGISAFSGARSAMLAGGADRPPDPDSPEPCSLVGGPLFHVSGLHSAAVAMVANGVKSVWTTGRFDPEKVFQLTEQERITRWGGVTTQVWRLLEHPALNDYDHSSVKACGGGGSVWSPELQRAIRERLPDAAPQMQVGYGSTETGALATIATSQMLRDDPTCAGTPLPTVQVQIRDSDGNRVPDGAVGEVCVRGPNVMPGYWNQPEATAAAFFDGHWLRTGDFGHMHGDMLTIASRIRDMIIRGGENVYPIEIENRLEEHPDIGEAAVIGVDHRTLGQEVKAVVVPQPGSSLDTSEIQQFVGEKLAYYKVPAHVEIRTDPLPRNASGKVLKHVLSGDAANQFVEE